MPLFEKRNQRALISLYFVTILTLCFLGAEIFRSYSFKNLTIATDSSHLIYDLITFIISIFAIKIAEHNPTKKYSYGFQRAEALGALASIVLIWAITGLYIYLAIIRLVYKTFKTNPELMMISAGISICVHVVAGVVLFFGRSAHTHFGLKHRHDPVDHTHGPTDTKDKKNPVYGYHTNINIRASFIHVVSDLIQAFGVVFASVVIKFTNWYYVDPISTIIFSFIVYITTYYVAVDIVAILMEGAPPYIKAEDIQADLLKIPGVDGLHSFRFWSMKMDSLAASVHLDVGTSSDPNRIIQDAQQLLSDKYLVDFSTIQVQCASQKPKMPKIRSRFSLHNVSSEHSLRNVRFSLSSF